LAGLARAGDRDGVTAVRLEWEPGFVGTNQLRHATLAKQPPAGLTPPKGAEDARFARFEFGEGRVVFVAVDREHLWLDTHLNGDLSNSRPRKWIRRDGRVQQTDTLLVPLKGEADPLPVAVYCRWSGDRVGLSLRIHRRGRVILGRRVRSVVLVDGNADFRFDDPAQDRLYVDIDGDGLLDGAKGSHERLTIGKPFHLQGKGYLARVPDRLGGRVLFVRSHPAPPPLERYHIEKWECDPVGVDVRPTGETLRDIKAGEDLVAAVQAAAHLGTRDAFDFLESTCRREKKGVAAQWAIYGMRYKPYRLFAARVEKLVLDMADPVVRRFGVFALHGLEAPRRARIYTELLAPPRLDPRLAGAAAQYLAFLGPKQAKTLAAAYRRKKDGAVRYQVFLATVRTLPGDPPRKLLAAGLKDKEDDVRRVAMDTLWRLRDQSAYKTALAMIGSSDGGQTAMLKVAARIIGSEGDAKAVAACLYRYSFASGSLKSTIASVLRAIRRRDGIKAMVAGLKEKRYKVRAFSTDLLHSIPDSGATPALVAAIRKEDGNLLRDEMIRALGGQDDARAVKALLRFATDKDLGTRAAAIEGLAEIGFGHPKVGPYLRKLLTSARWESRVLALGAAARTGDASLVLLLARNLDHGAWQVRIAAAEALGILRPRAAIEPLVTALQVEKERRVRYAIVTALFRLTGKEFFTAAEWRQWWGKAKAGFAVPKRVPRRKPARGGTVATFYGVPVRTDRVCFVLDASGSMDSVDAASKEKRTRLEVAKAELLAAVARLSDKARVNVVLFDTKWRQWQKSAVPLGAANRKGLERYVTGQKTAGHTNLYGGLEAALADAGIDTVYLLSDGIPDRGSYTRTATILRAVRRLNQTRRVAIHTIAVGLDSELLNALAAENGGRHVRR